MTGFRSLAVVVTLLLPVANHAAGTSDGKSRKRSSADRQSSSKVLDELDQVVVVGTQRTGRADIAAWFRRMAGDYRDTGSLTYAAGANVEVWGKTTCFVFGQGPGLQCTLNLRSDDRATNLNPGIVLFSFDLDRPLIRFMAVEDTGSGEGSIGELVGDTATFRAECEYRRRVCYRTTAITARPDSDQVIMQVAIDVEGTMAAQYEIIMIRLPGAGAAQRNAGAGDAGTDRNDKGPR